MQWLFPFLLNKIHADSTSKADCKNDRNLKSWILKYEVKFQIGV